MSVFEYASGLISIVIGLAVARVLGGIGSFIVLRDRSFSDWIVAAWCFALVFILVAWWMIGWVVLRGQSELAFTTLFLWVVASALLYLGTFVLLPGAVIGEAGDPREHLRPLRAAFYFCLAGHFGVVLLVTLARGVADGWGAANIGILAALSAAGATASSSRGHALHLAILLAWIAATVSLTFPNIGEAGQP
jgi:hypothetical protein